MEKHGAVPGVKQFGRLFHDQFDQSRQIQLGHNRPAHIETPALAIYLIQQLAVFLATAFTMLADIDLAWFSHDAFSPRTVDTLQRAAAGRAYLGVDLKLGTGPDKQL